MMSNQTKVTAAERGVGRDTQGIFKDELIDISKQVQMYCVYEHGGIHIIC